MPVQAQRHIDEANCPIRYTIDLIGGKWKPIILFYLKDGPIRHGKLQRLIPHASQKVLTQNLRELENSQLVERRTELVGNVKYVEYSYAPRGRTLAPVLIALASWGEHHQSLAAVPKEPESAG